MAQQLVRGQFEGLCVRQVCAPTFNRRDHRVNTRRDPQSFGKLRSVALCVVLPLWSLRLKSRGTALQINI